MVLPRQPIPVLGTSDNPRKLIELLIARNALELLLSEQCIFLVLLVLRNHQNDLLDLGLQKEQSLLDLQLVALQVHLVVELTQLLLKQLTLLVVLLLSHLGLHFGPQIFKTGEELSLQGSQLILKFGDAVLFDQCGQIVDVLHLLLETSFVEVGPVLQSVQFGPQFHHLGLELVYRVF